MYILYENIIKVIYKILKYEFINVSLIKILETEPPLGEG
jgi:hypothetical protein